MFMILLRETGSVRVFDVYVCMLVCAFFLLFECVRACMSECLLASNFYVCVFKCIFALGSVCLYADTKNQDMAIGSLRHAKPLPCIHKAVCV